MYRLVRTGDGRLGGGPCGIGPARKVVVGLVGTGADGDHGGAQVCGESSYPVATDREHRTGGGGNAGRRVENGTSEGYRVDGGHSVETG